MGMFGNQTALAALYSAIESQKRKAKGLFTNPMAQLEQIGGQIKDDPESFAMQLATMQGAIKPGTRVKTPTGNTGVVLSNRRIPEQNMDAWNEYRSKLHKQAFQGYESGQLTFDQASQLFDILLERNKATLDKIRKSPSGKFTDWNRVDFGKGIPKNYKDDELIPFTGPKILK